MSYNINRCYSCRKIISPKYPICYQCYLKPNYCKLCLRKIEDKYEVCYNCKFSADNKDIIKKYFSNK